MDNVTLCSAMMVALWPSTREMGDEDECDVDDTGRCEESGIHLARLG